ncbi:hypothetical protein CPB86DRAFT_818213 [Serendipita vermifera]|nr:hypothetical protein CPB86DRAFT_818213 [Serendipita vermifera]
MAHILHPVVLSMFMGKVTRPNPLSRDIEAVSGLYGPGAYIAWVLCTISAIISTSSKSNSSKFPPDMIASLVYSTVSTYWYHGRWVWYQPQGLDLLQDCSIQAGAFVFNVAAFFHDISLLLSTETKILPWVFIVLCDFWLGCISPMLNSHEYLGAVGPVLQAGVLVAVVVAICLQSRPWVFCLISCLHFMALELPRTQLFTASLVFWPQTASRITDFDQIVYLVTGMAFIAYRWELWNLLRTSQNIRTKFRRSPLRSNSIMKVIRGQN